MSRRWSEEEIEEAVDGVIEEIEAHDLAGADVPRSNTIEFYDAIIARCVTSRDGIKHELERDGEGDDSVSEEDSDDES